METTELEEWLSDACSTLIEVDILESLINKKECEIKEFKRQIAYIYQKKDRIWSIILAVFFGIQVLIGVIIIIDKIFKDNIYLWFNIFGTLIFIVMVTIFLCIWYMPSKKRKEKVIALNQLIQNHEYELILLRIRLQDKRIMVNENICFFPPKYHTYQAISYMLESVQKMNAKTLKEAICQYEQSLKIKK